MPKSPLTIFLVLLTFLITLGLAISLQGVLGVNIAGPLTGILNLGGNKITNVGTPTVAGDAATRGFVESTVPVLNSDRDGDGHNNDVLVSGDDCDDHCPTCYAGSAEFTASPDFRDQNCNGTVDEQILIAPTVCSGPADGVNNIKISAINVACNSFCGVAGGTISCTTYSAGSGNYSIFNFSTCSPSGGDIGWAPNCVLEGAIKTATCSCNPIYR